MQIHELTKKTITEGEHDWFGLKNPSTQQALDSLVGSLRAKFTRNPRYKNLPLDQRMDVMARDESIAQLAREKTEEFINYYKQLMYSNQNQSLGPDKFKAAMYNFLSRRLFGRDVARLTPEFKQKLDATITQAQRAKFDFRTGFSAEFDQAMKDLVALKMIAQFESTAQPFVAQTTSVNPAAGKITTPPSPGAPTPAEQAKLQQMIQQKLGKAE